MNDKTCQTCLHFHQHYTLKCGKLLRVFYGHCVFPTAKPKRPFSKACENYIYCLPDEDAYADKKYLTKEMLNNTNYCKNAYQNHNELLPHMSQNSYLLKVHKY